MHVGCVWLLSGRPALGMGRRVGMPWCAASPSWRRGPLSRGGGGLLAGLVLQGSLNSGPARPHVGQAQQKVCCCCCMYSPAWLAG